MSTFDYIKNEMSYKERGTWIDLAVAAYVAVSYTWSILAGRNGLPLMEVAFRGPMFRAILISIGATIALHIIYAIFSGDTSAQEDQRDRQVSRFGDWVSLFPLSVGALAGLVLAMYDQHHFWIAHAIFLGFFLSSITGSITRLIAYRRGTGMA